jgi:hypothetical protein
MKRPMMKALALIAVAGSLLAFELVGLRAAWPHAARALATTPIARSAATAATVATRAAGLPVTIRAETIALPRLARFESRRGQLVVVRTTTTRTTCENMRRIEANVRESVMSVLREAVL